MAWLSSPDDDATEELSALTEPWRRRAEQVPPVMAVLKSNPRAFQAVLELNYAVTFGSSSLGRQREELIAVWVSALNDCFFCLATHARYLESAWTRPAQELQALLARLFQLAPRVREAGAQFRNELSELSSLPGLSDAERELLWFVSELTLAPQANTEAGCARLRNAGHSEREVLDSVLVAACFAFMNRLACSTGVALDAAKYAAAERLFGRAALERHVAWARGGEPPR